MKRRPYDTSRRRVVLAFVRDHEPTLAVLTEHFGDRVYRQCLFNLRKQGLVEPTGQRGEPGPWVLTDAGRQEVDGIVARNDAGRTLQSAWMGAAA